MNIFLSKRAERNFSSIKIQIANRIGINVAEAFEERIANFLILLGSNPDIGSMENPKLRIRAFQITKLTRVFYRIEIKKIVILSFFDVRQEPNKKS